MCAVYFIPVLMSCVYWDGTVDTLQAVVLKSDDYVCEYVNIIEMLDA